MTLATIQRIDKLSPIEKADFIETANVLGWQVVVKKGEFKEKDLCIYVEIDSLIPRKEWSEFLFKTPPQNTVVGNKEGDEKEINLEYYRLRTIKLRGQISQGLVLPLQVVHTEFAKKDPFYYDGNEFLEWTINDNVTNTLGIKKYEKPTPHFNPKSGMKAKGSFPEFLNKTDEIRIQSKPELIDALKDKDFYITLKMDGTSATYYNKGKFGVCSRNLELKDPTKNFNSFIDVWLDKIKRFLHLKDKNKKNPRTHDLDIYWKMAYKYKIMDWLPEGYCIQGEICGPSIQGNKLGLENHELFIFNVFDINKQKYFNPSDFAWLDDATVGDVYKNEPIKFVPLIYNSLEDEFNLRLNLLNLDYLIGFANDLEYLNKAPAEGIVVRSFDQEISFKVVSNKFLLKYGE